MTLTETFSDIYHNNSWRSKESRSGKGSELSTTTSIRTWLPQIIQEEGVKSILDVGCGDFNWMREIGLKIPYFGIDVVPDLIKHNIETCGSIFPPTKLFAVADATKDILPKADLVMCRCVLYHLSYANIEKALANIKKSAARFLLITNSISKHENRDIVDGGYRRLNFLRPPFDFEVPYRIFRENETNKEEMLLYKM